MQDLQWLRGSYLSHVNHHLEWQVPQQLWGSFRAATLLDRTTFSTFDLTVDKSSGGAFLVHTGSARKLNGTVEMGYVWGQASAQIQKPYIRHQRPGQCGDHDKATPRGYTDAELDKIKAGLEAFAFKAAASYVPASGPPSPDPAPPLPPHKRRRKHGNKAGND